MSRLTRVIQENEAAEEKKSKKKKVIPVYDIYGKTITPEKKRRDRTRTITIVTVAGLLAVIYLPGHFIKEKKGSSSYTVEVDYTAIKKSNDYLKNNPDADFDNDGLINSEETSKGTNPWNVDTDGDFMIDLCELNYSKTDALTADSEFLINAQKKEDKANGKSLGSPYKIGNVILWADDYVSKATGSVVETLKGYRFCGFNGYAQFPEEDGNYAYKVEDGVHVLLDYREDENVWKVSDGDDVEIYDEELEETIEFSFFGKKVYGPSNIATKLAAKILPDKGWITAMLKMKVDVEPDTDDVVTTTIDTPIYEDDSDFRFGNNNNSLNDLLFVRESIDSGCCVAVSLYNADEGEYIGVIYGYDSDGDFLVADKDSLEPIGTLNIEEKAYKMMNAEGKIASVSYFDFSGFGFNSLKGDHISFFAASIGDGSDSTNQLLEDHLEQYEEQEETDTTEETVEETTEETAEEDTADESTTESED